MTRNARPRRRLLALTLIAALLGPAAALGPAVGVDGTTAAAQSDGPVVTVDDVEVDPGATATADVRLGPFPDGFVGYSFTVAVANPSTASIANVSYNDDLGFTNREPEYQNGGATVTVAAVNFDGQVSDPSATKRLFTLTVRGEADGTTALEFREKSVEDDDGQPVGASVTGGSVVVGDGTADGGSNTTVIALAAVGIAVVAGAAYVKFSG